MKGKVPVTTLYRTTSRLYISTVGLSELAQEEFWGGLRRAATECAQLMDDKLISEAKVCNFYVHLNLKEHVIWL